MGTSYTVPHWALGPPAGNLSISTWFTLAIARSRFSKGLRAAKGAGIGGNDGKMYLVLFSRQLSQASFPVVLDAQQFLPGVKVPHSSQAFDKPKRPHLPRNFR